MVDGSIEVRGGNVRIRGLTITGDLTVFGNELGMSFSIVKGAVQACRRSSPRPSTRACDHRRYA